MQTTGLWNGTIPAGKTTGDEVTDLGLQEGTAQVEAALAELNKRQSACTFSPGFATRI